jgi:hypothetical protein
MLLLLIVLCFKVNQLIVLLRNILIWLWLRLFSSLILVLMGLGMHLRSPILPDSKERNYTIVRIFFIMAKHVLIFIILILLLFNLNDLLSDMRQNLLLTWLSLVVGVMLLLELLMVFIHVLYDVAEKHVLVGTHLILGDISPGSVGAQRSNSL